MDFGAAYFATDYSIDVVELARALEERGFESLFLAEHTHIPVSRQSPWPGGPELPRHYWHTLDPFVALAAAAAGTSRIRLGTGVCLVVERDPIITAKEVASLDLLSGGRVLFGVGAGCMASVLAAVVANRWFLARRGLVAAAPCVTEPMRRSGRSRSRRVHGGAQCLTS